MQKNTATQTATTFTVLLGWTPEDRELLAGTKVWKSAEDAREALALVEDGDLEHHVHYAPGLEVHVFYTYGDITTIMVFEDETAARLHKAVRREQPVTVTYVKADGDETVRTIEPTSLSTTKAGDVIVKALDRKSDQPRTFRLDRVRTYTVHRTRRTVRTEAPAPTKAQLWEQWTATRPAPEPEPETVAYEWDVYPTTPGTADALTAPEAVQDRLADAWARGREFEFVTV